MNIYCCIAAKLFVTKAKGKELSYIRMTCEQWDAVRDTYEYAQQATGRYELVLFGLPVVLVNSNADHWYRENNPDFAKLDMTNADT